MANIAYTLQGLNSHLGLGDWKKLFFLTQSFTLSSWCFPLLPYASAADCPLASPCPVQRFGLCIGLDQVRDLQLSEHTAEEAAGDDLALWRKPVGEEDQVHIRSYCKPLAINKRLTLAEWGQPYCKGGCSLSFKYTDVLAHLSYYKIITDIFYSVLWWF